MTINSEVKTDANNDNFTALIEALTIFRKYGDHSNPTYCAHDVLNVTCDPELVSADDLMRLDELGFFPDDEGMFSSFRFGSA